MILAILLLAANILVTNYSNDLQQTDEAKKVKAVVTGIIDADNDRNLVEVLRLYEKDAILFPPGESEVKGVESIKPRYERLFNDFELKITTIIAEIEVADHWAYVRGANFGKLKSLSGGEERQLSDVYLMILHKNDQGIWRIARLIWHSAPTQNKP